MAQFYIELFFKCVSESKWHLEGSGGQELWYEVGGEGNMAFCMAPSGAMKQLEGAGVYLQDSEFLCLP